MRVLRVRPGEPGGQVAGGGGVAGLQSQLGGAEQGVGGPGVVGVVVGDLQEPRPGVVGVTQGGGDLRRSEEQKWGHRRPGEPGEGGVGGGEGLVEPVLVALEARQGVGGGGAEPPVPLGQRREQGLGVGGLAQADQGLGVPEAGLGEHRAVRGRLLQGLEGGDRFGGAAGLELDHADLEPGLLDPVRGARLGDLAEQIQRRVRLAQLGQGAGQAVPGAVDQSTVREVVEGVPVGVAGGRQVAQAEPEVAEVGPGGFEVPVVRVLLDVLLQRLPGGGQVAEHVGGLADAEPGRGAVGVVRRGRVEERFILGAGLAVLAEEQPGGRQAVMGLDGAGAGRVALQKLLVLLGREVIAAVAEQLVGEGWRGAGTGAWACGCGGGVSLCVDSRRRDGDPGETSAKNQARQRTPRGLTVHATRGMRGAEEHCPPPWTSAVGGHPCCGGSGTGAGSGRVRSGSRPIDP